MQNYNLILENNLKKPRVKALLDRLRNYDEETYRHSLNVAYTIALMTPYLFHDVRVEDVCVSNLVESALLHDIGKLSVPREVLHKPGQLDKRELAYIRQHPINGINYLNGEFSKVVYDVVFSHHEKLDGSGYPCGYLKEEIPEAARIVAVADMYSAITEKRCYKDAFGKNQAVDILMKELPDKIDERFLDVLLMAVTNHSMELEESFKCERFIIRSLSGRYFSGWSFCGVRTQKEKRLALKMDRYMVDKEYPKVSRMLGEPCFICKYS